MMKTQMKKSLIVTALPLLALGAMMVPGSACDGADALCCTENDFQVGGTVNLGGDAKAEIAGQAVADFAGVASVMIDDVLIACRNIAKDLDAPADKQEEAEAKESKRDQVKAWCDLAVGQIGTFKASAQASIKIKLPECKASASASMDCKASCSVDGKCDFEANPPTCEGGKMEVSCSGGCTAEVGASVKCEGSCTAECSGECTATAGGVECKGKCEGTCSASAEGGGSGIQADGTCDGKCEGTCAVTAPGATCSGSCKGDCKGECKAEAGASVKCDGKCDVAAEPISCSGGDLKAECNVDAKCDANCSAGVEAKASCTPASVDFKFTGDAKAAAKLKATLQANLQGIASASVKFNKVFELGGQLKANVSGLASIKPVCIPVLVKAMTGAFEDVKASGEATVSVMATLK